MRLSAFDTYCLYLALKNHFSRDSYDFFKYQGKTGVSKDAFLNRRDKFQFAKLARMYDDTEMRDFMLANFLHDSAMWVGALLEDDAKDRYMQYKKRKESLSYIFENEIDKAFSSVDDPKQLFKCDNGIPQIITLYMQHEVSIETFVLLNLFINFFDKFDRQLVDDFIWSKLRMKCIKFLPFIVFDQKKLASILKKRLNAHIYT